MEKPVLIDGVHGMLKDLKLEKYQKHPHFHILKVEDHIDEMPRYSNVISKNIFEITYGTDYDLTLSVDNVDFDAKKGHLSFLAPGQSFYMDGSEEDVGEDGMAYLIFFTTEFLWMGPTDYSIIKGFPYFNKHVSPVYYVNGESEKKFLWLFQKVYDEFQQLNDDNFEILESYVTILLFEIKRSLKEQAFVSNKTSRAEEITFLFENLLKETAKKRQKIDFYANKLNVSSIYLAECVKKVTGNSPKKVITDYVIMEAKSLLLNSSRTVEQVGHFLGFEEASNFINFFKKNAGLTPNQYKKQMS